MIFDSIIIGSGPAGISAGLYIARAGYNVVVISKNESTLDQAKKIENYYGFEKSITGKELKQHGINQAKKLGIEIVEKEVTAIKYTDNNCFEIVVAENGRQRYIARTVVLATGINRNVAKIPGIADFEGRGISYCAICDGAFYKNRDVAVLGNGNFAIEEIEQLLLVAKSVTMLTNGQEPPKFVHEKLIINTNKIQKFTGTNKLGAIEFENGAKIKIDGIFIAQGVASSVDFAKKLGARIENNYIVVNEDMETTVPKIYACGDCTGGILQISKAVYEGTKAGLQVINKLKERKNV